MEAQMFTLGHSAIDHVEIALSLTLLIAIILQTLWMLYRMQALETRIAQLTHQLQEEGCHAYTSGRLSLAGGVFDRFHREAHTRASADAGL